jgi:hypothetical protein
MWHELGRRTLLRGYNAVVATGEAWTAQVAEHELRPYLDLESRAEHGEAVITTMASADGQRVQIASPIFRLLGRGYLRPVKQDHPGQAELAFLNPIFQAWDLRQGMMPSRSSTRETISTPHEQPDD